jgi:hypothetical protein
MASCGHSTPGVSITPPKPGLRSMAGTRRGPGTPIGHLVTATVTGAPAAVAQATGGSETGKGDGFERFSE